MQPEYDQENTLLMTPPYFPIELAHQLETLGFPIVYYAPLIVDAIKVNGDYSMLYDALENDQRYTDSDISLESLIELYDVAAKILLDHIYSRPQLHRLLTSQINEIIIDPNIPNTWIVQFWDDESAVDIAKNMQADYHLQHIGALK